MLAGIGDETLYQETMAGVHSVEETYCGCVHDDSFLLFNKGAKSNVSDVRTMIVAHSMADNGSVRNILPPNVTMNH